MVALAKESGLAGVAITDHDTTAGWSDASDAAVEYAFPVLRGTEITADDEGVSVHMLAYQYDPLDPDILAVFERTRQARLKRAKLMVAAMSKDYPITWEDVMAQVKEGEKTTVGRPHIADALVAAGIYSTRTQAFAGLCSSRSPYYLPTPSPTAHEVVAAVRAAGGVSVVAHAGDRKRNRILLSDGQIETLIEEGLNGLEVWHRDNDNEQRQRLLGIAQQHHLLVTGGSDWHGDGKPNKLGEHTTDQATVDQILNMGSIALVPGV
jgi:predicted metal-dependent phosphoesterase TrpH